MDDANERVGLALAPDIIDKPLSRLIPGLVHHNTRGFGHTLLFSAFVFVGLLIWKRRPKAALLLWACYAGHFLLDAMWLSHNPTILFWPLLGDFPLPMRGPFFSGPMLWNILGEIAGLAMLFRLYRRGEISLRA